jgi:hypothetical protein
MGLQPCVFRIGLTSRAHILKVLLFSRESRKNRPYIPVLLDDLSRLRVIEHALKVDNDCGLISYDPGIVT